MNRHLVREYGITIEDYEELYLRQGGKCGICDRTYDGAKKLAVDHCHERNVVRGLLCENCNRGIGMFKDDIGRLKLAITYLKNSKRKQLMVKADLKQNKS